MGNIARVFIRDLKRLAKAPAAWSVALFLILLPSLYSWFNVAAFWNPYENTGNLRVCVVNEDKGFHDATMGDLNIGQEVVETLQGNDQLGWAFLSREEAMKEVDSGKAYAAFVIPENFSANVATLLSNDFQRPKLEYYVNEKMGPVSPKITDTGANSLDTSINDAFFSTVSSVVTTTLNDRLDDLQLGLANAKAQASSKVGAANEAVKGARGNLAELNSSIESARGKARSAQESLEGAKSQLNVVSNDIKRASDLVAGTNTDLAKASADAATALDESSAQFAKASAETRTAIAQTTAAIEAARSSLATTASDLPAPDFSSLIETLKTLRESPLASDEQKQEIDRTITKLEDLQNRERWSADTAAIEQQLGSATSTTTAANGEFDSLVEQTMANANSYRSTISTQTAPAISAGIGDISAATAELSAAVSSQKVIVDQASAVLDQLQNTLSVSGDAIAKTDNMLADLENDLSLVKTDLDALGSANALSKIVGDGGIDPDKVADFMMSPTKVETEELYPLNAYGSAMAPLFINLTLWIGVFMLMVIIRLEVDDEGIENLTIAQRFLGRGILLAIMASLQAAVCCAGCIVLGVQTANAPLFFVTAIIASLAYLSIQYTLSASLQHLGKALCVILVFVQIPGATGLYPIEMTPEFFRVVYPMFPFTYGINAIRETISGFYGFAWLQNVGVLAAFWAIFLAIGVLIRPYLTNLNRLFAREIGESDLIIGESVQLPARRYRMSHIIRAFAERDEYREALNNRVQRFMNLYPKLKQGAFVVGIAVPVLSTTLLAICGVEKVVILTTWLIWFLLIVTYYIMVEYLQDYLSHLVSLEAMSADEVRSVVAQRERFTRVKPIAINPEGERADEALPDGEAPRDGEAPVDGEAPPDGEAPRDGEALLDGEALPKGSAPSDGEEPSKSSTPSDDGASSNGEAPPDGELPSDGEVPSEGGDER